MVIGGWVACACRAVTASPGTWSPAATSYTYQWQRSTDAGRSWGKVTGASSATYTVAVADEGATLRVVVTAVNTYGQATAASAAGGPVKASPPVNIRAPMISGTVKLGSTLTATSRTWSGAGNTYRYQWQRNVGRGYVSIDGATASNYTPTHDDAQAALRVSVNAANPDGSASQASSSTTAVAAAVRR